MEETVVEVRESRFKRFTVKYGRNILIALLAIIIGYGHTQYVNILFENDLNFSMLSDLEREMSFRSEQGFYYSYYKTIVEEEPYVAAITRIMYDKHVEYPNEVNAFNRFNIIPEVILGSVYRYLYPYLNGTVSCTTVFRGDDIPSVESCNGLGVPMIFYVQSVFILAGVTLGALFIFGTTLSNSILGGLVTVAQYLANHADCTRVALAPALRENYAQPALLLQMWLLTAQLRGGEQALLGMQVSIFLINCVCLLFWQFTQFIFFTQIFIFFVMEQLRIIDLKTFCIFLHSHFCGLHMAILLLQGNDMLKTSIYTSFFIVVSIYCLFFSNMRIAVETRLDLILESFLVVMRIAIVMIMSICLKTEIREFLLIFEDAHIWEILWAKISDYQSFHTKLYTCSEAFDFLPLETWGHLWDSTLVPIAFVCVVNVTFKWIVDAYTCVHKKDKVLKKKKKAKDSDSSDDDSGIENTMPEHKEDKIDEQEKEKEDNEDNKQIEVKKDDTDNAEEIKNKPKTTDKKNKTDLCVKEKEKPPRDELLEFLMNLKIDAGIFYNVSQMVAFMIMAVMIMRLKLLFVPHMCLVASLVVTFEMEKFKRWPRAGATLRSLFFTVLFAMIAWKAYTNVQGQMKNLGEFSDLQLEELLQWISQTPAAPVFAGPVPVTSAVLLSARRPIVNHPHYENKEARARTYAVYKTYGKFSPLELYVELSRLKVTHLIVDRDYCYGSGMSDNCTFESIWDREAPAAAGEPRLCHLLLTSRVDHFYSVFRNHKYSVFKIHDFSVRYMPRSFDT
ncbi:hypothetical protein JYU34_018212 [Plutella xylostella]|uniref:C-mannosyltransferase DPY19L1 n=1 Tax=Plutella xylostella TaxID=51655 RepID=A0ABQ7Q002_PLUXY|nr:hypothetical protein JYU34_018212 [Plutella xylostella]